MTTAGGKNLSRLGWRARIGVITPAIGLAVTSEFHKIAPEGVAMMLAHVAKPLVTDSVEELSAVGDGVEEAARTLAKYKASVVLWNTTSASLIRGVGYDRELVLRMQEASGVVATTSSTAMIDAFAALGVRKVAVAMPYVEAVNVLENAWIEAHGLSVVKHEGMQILDTAELVDTAPAAIHALAKRVDHPDADAVFISCAGWGAIDTIESLERELGKPVLSTNQLSLWKAFRLAGIDDRIEGYGRLLREA